VEAMMNREWMKPNGERYIVSLCAIDSGDQTDMVYDICAMNSEWAIPIKGSSKPLLQPYRISIIDKAGSRATGMRLVMVDTHQYKTMIANRINRPNGRGAWMLFKDCDRDYAEQIASEQRVQEQRGNTEVMVWVPKTAHAANHYLAAEAYCFCAADLMGARYLEDAEND
jgi:phage terminase large subunit GpA-like protein